jgi:hypothetical protein
MAEMHAAGPDTHAGGAEVACTGVRTAEVRAAGMRGAALMAVSGAGANTARHEKRSQEESGDE